MRIRRACASGDPPATNRRNPPHPPRPSPPFPGWRRPVPVVLAQCAALLSSFRCPRSSLPSGAGRARRTDPSGLIRSAHRRRRVGGSPEESGCRGSSRRDGGRVGGVRAAGAWVVHEPISELGQVRAAAGMSLVPGDAVVVGCVGIGRSAPNRSTASIPSSRSRHATWRPRLIAPNDGAFKTGATLAT